MMEKPVWATPRTVTNLDECIFYHTMDLPDHGTVLGQWDLRGKESTYLGGVEFQGRRVLEFGTASGHLCFYMERTGAEVTAYDLSDEQEWDIVPYTGYDYAEHIAERRSHMRLLNNSYWLAHNALNSSARVVYGTIYDIPQSLGKFDICTLGSILLHLRDPFLALQRVSAHANEMIIVTDLVPALADEELQVTRLLAGNRLLRFLPNSVTRSPTETWWELSPELIVEFLHILGFEETTITFHNQWYETDKREVPLYTIVGRRSGRSATGPKKRPRSTKASDGEDAARVLEEMTMKQIRLSHLAKHVIRRSVREVFTRTLTRK